MNQNSDYYYLKYKHYKRLYSVLSGGSSLTLNSTDFDEGDLLPEDVTCLGKGIKPSLEWSNPPTGTQSYALILHDPDARKGIFFHWIVYNIPASDNNINNDTPADRYDEGINSADKKGYTAPCPPKGEVAHRYIFTLYALDDVITASDNVTGTELLVLIEPKVLGKATLTGFFGRNNNKLKNS